LVYIANDFVLQLNTNQPGRLDKYCLSSHQLPKAQSYNLLREHSKLVNLSYLGGEANAELPRLKLNFRPRKERAI
jgi:hypothetical protein